MVALKVSWCGIITCPPPGTAFLPVSYSAGAAPPPSRARSSDLGTAGFTLYMVTIIAIYSVKPELGPHRGELGGPAQSGAS